MRVITLDYETAWSSDYSLRKMPPLLYIRDPRFKVHGCAIKEGGGTSYWVRGPELPKVFDELQLETADVVSHNANFDMTVLWEKYGHRPKRYIDTLGLCRALLYRDLNFDLGSICPLLGVGEKGTELESSKGLWELPPHIDKALGRYSCNDDDLTYGLFQVLWPMLPEFERDVMHLVIHMATVGMLRWNPVMAAEAKQEVVDDRNRKLAIVGVTPEQLRSRDKFAALLREHGVEPPTKISPTTGKETYAFSKQDPQFVALSSNPDVAALVEAKVSWASNNAITRIDNLTQICARPPYTLPVQVNYNGAHTGRLSGGGKINMQNLNARGVGAKLRLAIHAPEGYGIAVKDLSGIELRMNMWFSGETKVLEQIKNGGDPYKTEAASQFGVSEADVTKTQRQYGKVVQLGCFSGDTLVLTHRGLQPLHSIRNVDLVWDGVEWVRHAGLVDRGYKEVIDLCGVKVTPDHDVLCGNSWENAGFLARNPNTLRRALATASENLPLLDTSLVPGVGSSPSSYNVVAAHQNTGLWPDISERGDQLDATSALRNRQGIGGSPTTGIPTSSKTTRIAPDCSIESRHVSTDVITRMIRVIQTTAVAVFMSTRHGGRIVESFFDTLSRWTAGIKAIWNSTVSMSTEAMNPAICALSLVERTCATGVLSPSYKHESTNSKQKSRVYDLALAGPRNRFTIWTDSGPLIVHNCGFYMGADRFRAYCAIGPMGMDPILISKDEAYRTIMTYRRNVPRVKDSWDWLGYVALPQMLNKDAHLARGPVFIEHESVLLPNGLRLQYPNLECTEEGWTWGIGAKHFVHGGILQENIVQALAGIVIKEMMVGMQRRFEELGLDANVVHQVHDEILVMCRDEDAECVMEIMHDVMTTPPAWAPDLPLAAEGGYDWVYSK